MRVRALKQGDVWVPGEMKARALYDGQIYDLPAEIVGDYDWLEVVEEPKARKSRKSDEAQAEG